MNPIDDPFESSSNITDEKVEAAEDLLDESWFFGNLLDKKTKTMLRCYSDPYPSSDYTQELLVRNSSGKNSATGKNLSQDDGFVRPKLIRTPSLPPCFVRDEGSEEKESDSRAMRKAMPQALPHSLIRAPSLPPCFGREEDAESDFSMSKLIRQASLKCPSDVLPPKHTSKGMKQSSSTPRHRPRKNPEIESIDIEASDEMRYQTKMNPSVVNIIPGLQEKNRVDFGEDKARRPYLSESWMVQSSAPPIPTWAGKRSSAEDMKAQIKFWARAVAANVR